MSDTTFISGGTVVTADDDYAGDVLIEGGAVAAVGRASAPEDATVPEASWCLVLPGLIDNHTHPSMPFMGMTSSDDYDTGTRAAAAGGVTCLVDFAIQREPDNLRSVLEQSSARAEGAAHVDYGFCMAITNGSEPVLDDMQATVEAGTCYFKLFTAYKGEPMAPDDVLTASMERARDLEALTMVHAENGDIVDLLVKRALANGDNSAIHHALTRREFVEAEATGRPDRRECRRAAVRRARHVRARGRRDRGLSAARRSGRRRDLRAVPDQLDRRLERPRGRGLPLPPRPSPERLLLRPDHSNAMRWRAAHLRPDPRGCSGGGAHVRVCLKPRRALETWVVTEQSREA